MIETRALWHRYGERVALRDVSVMIPDGQFVVLVGPNGSGKSTLVRHFNGLLQPSDGEVRVNGRSVQADLVAARTSVGMVFQNPRDQLVAATVGDDVAFGPENLGLSRADIDRRVANALKTVRMSDRHDERVVTLSGGERARVAIAGALAMEPSHLVLDEPFTGLDCEARHSVIDHLEQLADRGTAIIVVTHDPQHVGALVNRVIILDNGRVTLDGPVPSCEDRLAGLCRGRG